MQRESSSRTTRTVAETVVMLFMGVVALAASKTGLAVILFPELVALSHDVINRPQGKWASQPIRLILTPTATAIIGLFITRHLDYSVLSVSIIVVLSLIFIRLTQSVIGPAISAGVLPLVVGEKSWYYPLAILADVSLLVGVLILWKRYGLCCVNPPKNVVEDNRIVEARQSIPQHRYTSIVLMLFVIVLGSIAQITGLRFLLFPPMIVMAYEVIGHPVVPDWMKRPKLFPLVCLLTASIGLLAHEWIHLTVPAVMVTTLCSVVLLRLFEVHMPPALAVGMLPFVIRRPDYRYPISVFFGTIALILFCFGYSRLLQWIGRRKNAMSVR
jgi:hypothetical protein